MIDDVILSQIVKNNPYSKIVLPHIDADYFEDDHYKVVYHFISKYINKYNTQPNKSALKVELEKSTLSEQIFEKSLKLIDDVYSINEDHDMDWLVEQTEDFCKERALNLAIQEAVKLSETDEKGHIPDVLKKALSISFNDHIGHDYFEDAESRFDFYMRKEDKIEFDLDLMNRITDGGLPRKAIAAVMAGTNVGKSLMLCHLAASYISQGYNVLYITLEMAEEWISKRIDANLFDININDINDMTRDEFSRKISALKSKVHGRLIVNEYPTSSAHVGHFRHLLSELKLKKDFIPDVIIVDYVNIMASLRFKVNKGMYEYVKSIAEELRGLAVETNTLIWTATQVNRDGLKSTDFDMTDTSESMGLTHTLDFFIGMISTEELERINIIKIKQLKNRYGPKDRYGSFALGIDRPKMRLYDSDDQSSITKDASDKNSDENSNIQSVRDKFKGIFE